ncbi:hypothetical protein BGU55_18780 [Clostridioides difficile]|uniref:hypothetical protein n=1 Tax=Clostridioides difficile TaxID=1496 RepID=UPI000BB1D447|nr:hypothetical protein [Clostridioides difficile]PBI02322.1 hypothetical protein BGU55_18780 [Clostridioides difficile]
MGQKAGSAVGAVLDTKNKVKDKATAVKENIKEMPTPVSYTHLRVYETVLAIVFRLSLYKSNIDIKHALQLLL